MEYDLEKISNNIKKKNQIKSVIRIIAFSILFILFLICTFLINYDQSTDEPNNFLGMYVFDIVSESMVPTLNVDDIVFAKKTDLTNLKENDIIAFRRDSKIITHRIIRIEKNDGKTLFFTKGDNNKSEDNFSTEYDQIYGRVIFTVPVIGKQIRYLHKENGIIIILIFVAIVFCIQTIRDRKKNIRKKVRWKYETKKKREKYIKEEEYEEKI